MIRIAPFKLFILAVSVLFASGCNTTTETDTPPNILLIMADDMGYSDIGCYGSEIPTPNIDRLAEEGVRFTQFYNEARCCPTRAAMLTGLYQHQVGMGGMTEGQMYPDGTLIPSYAGYLNDRCVTIAEVLKKIGYQTFLSGKWHVGDTAISWPSARGFDRTFSLIWGASNYFNTELFLNEHQEVIVTLDGRPVKPERPFYFTDLFTRYASDFIEGKEADRPFFLYLSYTAPHWPIQAPEPDIDRFRGTYMAGWDSLRMKRFRRMVEMGLLPEGTVLSPKYKDVPDWDTLSRKEKAVWDLRMAVYAAMIHRMDSGIGEVLDLLESRGELDNTIVMFLSDNGATRAEMWWATQWIADRSGPIGSEQSLDSYGKWANTSNVPFRRFKGDTYEGGIITPFILRWPEKVDPGMISDYPGHVIDIMPTLLEAAGTHYPERHDGKDILPAEGHSLLPLILSSDAEMPEPELYWEHFGDRAVRIGDWKLVKGKEEPEWNLYDLSTDPTELNDLSEIHPGRVADMEKKYNTWADRVGALPDSIYDDLVLVRNADWFEK